MEAFLCEHKRICLSSQEEHSDMFAIISTHLTNCSACDTLMQVQPGILILAYIAPGQSNAIDGRTDNERRRFPEPIHEGLRPPVVLLRLRRVEWAEFPALAEDPDTAFCVPY